MAAFQPYKQSPAHRALNKLGAHWGCAEAWRIPEYFTSPSAEWQSVASAVGLSDLSHIGKVELTGFELEETLPSRLGLRALPAIGLGSVSGARAFYRFTHEQLLACVSEDEVKELQVWGAAGRCVHVTERTSGLACFLLAGPRSVDLLNQLSSLDLRDSRFPDLACTRAPLAQVNARVARRDRQGVRAYYIFVGREYGEYIWEALWHTGEKFGIAAVGSEALRADA